MSLNTCVLLLVYNASHNCISFFSMTLNQAMGCSRISLLDFADYLKYLYEDSGFLLAQQFQVGVVCVKQIFDS